VDLGLDEMSRLAQIVVAGLRALFESDIRSSIQSKYGSREQGGDQALGAEPTEASAVEEGFAAGGGRKAAVGQRGEDWRGENRRNDGALSGGLEVDVLASSEHGFSEWEVDALARRRASENVAAAAHVLGSLSRLVEQLPNLEMPDLIGSQVGTTPLRIFDMRLI
jgi:hypothetical protein